MKTTVEKHEDVTVVTLLGETLDASNTNEFKQAIGSILATNSKVVFDLSQLQFVDSAGVGAILSCLRVVNKKGGDLKLCGLTRPVRSLFEIVRMHRVFEIFDSQGGAVRAFGNSTKKL